MDDEFDPTTLPLLNEQGYELATDENGDPLLDENGEEIVANFGLIQVADVWGDE